MTQQRNKNNVDTSGNMKAKKTKYYRIFPHSAKQNDFCLLSGGVFHSCFPLCDVGHPAGQGIDTARCLGGRGLLPVSRSFSSGRASGGETFELVRDTAFVKGLLLFYCIML